MTDRGKNLPTINALMPVLGVAMGVWLLNEPFAPAFGVGATLILAGIALANMPRRR